MESIFLTLISLYLTYYTMVYARMTWKGGNKLAGAFITLLAACFPTLTIWFDLK